MQQKALEAKCVIVVLIEWDIIFLFLTHHPSHRLSYNKLSNHFKATHIKYRLHNFFSDIMFIKMKCFVAVFKQK